MYFGITYPIKRNTGHNFSSGTSDWTNMINYKRFVGILFSLIYTIREMSRQSSPFEVWGEIIFNQKS